MFRTRRKAIFVHGCFWHGHDCRDSLRPKSKQDYWNAKLAKNRDRDRANLHDLRERGWQVIVVWECETKKLDHLEHKLINFLED